MVPASLISRSSVQCLFPLSTCSMETSHTVTLRPPKLQHISRRVGAIALMTSFLLATEAITTCRTANSLDLRMTTPDQTVEEAESVIRDHAQGLLDVKSLIEVEDWREAQRELRRNAGYLKQDIYTIIQGKEGSIRPLLRRLYSDLFNNVTKLDYAARDKDMKRVLELYNNISAVLNDILSRI